MVVGELHKLLRLFHILLNGVMGSVEHDGGKSGLHTFLTSFVSAVIQMQRNGNGNVQLLYHSLNHGCHCLETGHILTGSLGHTKDDRRIAFLSSQKNCLRPLQIIDVELTYRIVSCFSLIQHLFCRY